MKKHVLSLLQIGLVCGLIAGSAEAAQRAGVGIEPGGLNMQQAHRDGLDIEPNG